MENLSQTIRETTLSFRELFVRLCEPFRTFVTAFSGQIKFDNDEGGIVASRGSNAGLRPVSITSNLQDLLRTTNNVIQTLNLPLFLGPFVAQLHCPE